jgi:hypothetical protein
VLGSLPRRRPGIESPRRARARAAGKPDPGPAREPEQQGSRSQLQELEQLARFGVKLAGGVAAAGLKLAGRTVGSLGRAVGRR